LLEEPSRGLSAIGIFFEKEEAGEASAEQGLVE
jgi:hypothetical protein